jgi:uncharacterized membrane protein
MKKIYYRITIVWYIWLGLTLALPQEYHIVERSRIVLWSMMLLFAPWYRITQAIFDVWEIDELEIIALSFAFSISVIPLLVFYLNLIWLRINQRLVFEVVWWCIILSRWRVAYKNKQTLINLHTNHVQKWN